MRTLTSKTSRTAAAHSRRRGAQPPDVACDITPNDDLGQNFLVDPATIRQEVAYANIAVHDRVLEIGAGPGHLTKALLETGAHVVAVEIDRQFESRLSRLAADYGTLTLLWGDALKVELPPVDKVVGNLPYQQTLPILYRLLDHGFHTGIFTIQDRLARRIVAKPGTQGYSRTSVLLQRVAGVRRLELVKREKFRPAPAVDSAILRIRPCRPRYAVKDLVQFSNVLEQAFARRDWTLGEVAQALGLDPARLSRDARGIDVSNARGEAIAQLADALLDAGQSVPPLTAEEKRKAQKLFSAKTATGPENTGKPTQGGAPKQKGARKRPRSRNQRKP